MTTPTDPRIDLVARTLDEVALASIEGAVPMATIREAAAELVEKLDAHPRIETDEDAVRVVDAVLDQCLVEYGDAHRALVDETATRIVDALLGKPIGTETEDLSTGVRTVTLQWPSDDVRAALVSREVLEAMVDEANELRAGADFRSVPDGVELTPAQAYGYLLTATPERRHELLADLLHQRSRGVRCWLHGHDEQIDNLRRDLDAARTQLAECHAEVRAALPPELVAHATAVCGECRGGHTTAEHIRANLAPLTSARTVEDIDRELVWIDKTILMTDSPEIAENGRRLAEQLRAERDKLAAAEHIERRPVWPNPEVAVDLIDHTDEPVSRGCPGDGCPGCADCDDGRAPYPESVERDADEEPST